MVFLQILLLNWIYFDDWSIFDLKKGAIDDFLIWEEGKAQNIYFFKKETIFIVKETMKRRLKGKGTKKRDKRKGPLEN